MRQILGDLALQVRSNRKVQLGLIVAVAIIGFLVLGDNSSSGRRRVAKPKPEVSVGTSDPDERWKDLIERFNADVGTIKADVAALRKSDADQDKKIQETEKTTAEILKKILERLAQVSSSQNAAATGGSAAVGGAPQLGAAPIALDPTSTDVLPSAPDELEPIGGETVSQQWPAQAEAKPKLAAVMVGDSVRVKLLSGVNAPTDGTPYPVVLKLIGNVLGPDGNNIPLGEARIIAAAQGSLTDARVLLRLTKLSLRLPNGRRKEFPIDGWVVGEDGLRGMEGVLIDPIGKAIGGASVAGAIGGIGQGIAAANSDTLTFSTGQQSRTVQSENIPEYAAGLGLAAGAREWSSIIRDRLSQLVPHVQVLSGREATAVFSQSFAIPDLLEQVDDDPSVVFTSLD